MVSGFGVGSGGVFAGVDPGGAGDAVFADVCGFAVGGGGEDRGDHSGGVSDTGEGWCFFFRRVRRMEGWMMAMWAHLAV